jgi:4-diphosphocytidyl-2-C-methyl-D-erythritol kinase
VFPAIGDRLSAVADAELSLETTGPFGASLAAEPDNLVLRAARALAAESGMVAGARLTLEKMLPVASGIGGGSADAAAALRLLARLWSVTADTAPIAARLGADVPVCLASRPARMQGIGDMLAPSPTLPPFGMVLVNPGIAVATPAVFRARTGKFSMQPVLPSKWTDAAELAADLSHTRNDLQPAAISLCPAIASVLRAIEVEPHCLLARMSGSGATCFGLFANPAQAAEAAARLSRPGWWSWGGTMSADLPDHGVGP